MRWLHPPTTARLSGNIQARPCRRRDARIARNPARRAQQKSGTRRNGWAMSYHDEQESLKTSRPGGRKWGNATTWVLLAALDCRGGLNGWNYWQRRQAAQGAMLYEQVQQAVTLKTRPKIARDASDMEDKFGGTAYAQMTALAAAKTLYRPETASREDAVAMGDRSREGRRVQTDRETAPCRSCCSTKKPTMPA